MKTNRLLQIALTACLLCMAATVHAQVTVGAGKEPETFSVLEIISNQTAGLRMPILTTEERNKMTTTFGTHKEGLAKGLTIYNSTIDCLEFWSGTKWISKCEGETPVYPVDPKAEVSSCLPYMFIYQTLTLTASYDGATPASPQWVVDGQAVAGANSTTFNYTPAINLALENDDLGNQKKIVKITCQMAVDDDIVQAADYEVLVVKATKGKLSPIYVWAHENGDVAGAKVKSTFAHVNLGAENDTDPCNMLGDMYQWGRQNDGHQLRSKAAVYAGPVSADDLGTVTGLDGQIVSTDPAYGLFVTNGTYPYNWRDPVKNSLWNGAKTAYDKAKGMGDPCPTGWKVPSLLQWSALYQGGDISGAPDDASSGSTWTRLGVMTPPTPAGSASGYKIAEALFLPSVGGRIHGTGAIVEGTSYQGHYWSSNASSTNSDYAMDLSFNATAIAFAPYQRGYGYAVRCVPNEGMPPYVPVTPTENVTITACAASSETASVPDDTGFYMFTYQTMKLYVNHGGTSTSYQWVVDDELVPGATGSTYSYTPAADIALTTDALGNQKKTVTITCQIKVDGDDFEPKNKFKILVVYGGTGKGELYPIYVWGHENGVIGATSVKVAFAHVNLGAEKDTDPCGCLGDLYQWGRPKDGHESRTPLSGTTNVQSTVAPPGHSDFIYGFPNWLTSDVANLWGDGQITYDLQPYDPTWAIPANNPCPSGWKVPSQKQWSALYQGGFTYGAPGASTSGSAWTAQGKLTIGSTSGYKVANALYLPAGGSRSYSTGSLSNVGYVGGYWSSTVGSSNSFSSYSLVFRSGDVNPSSYGTNRAYGMSVRCVPE